MTIDEARVECDNCWEIIGNEHDEDDVPDAGDVLDMQEAIFC
ncbi:MAG: hypothetical protein A4E28_00018 [Methanocella sp. PtaU1.Bin125]|nr:MAG: hypothetical protein A4E28_00018 [Methanocella sp. PtaU1.Bin125]